jgi:hypothetical protein
LCRNRAGKNVLKKTDLPYKQGALKESTLYRLTISKDNTVKVDVNQEEIYSGSLETDWDLLEPKEILDEDDKKPEDWVHLLHFFYSRFFRLFRFIC